MVALEDSFNKLLPAATRCKTCLWYNTLDAADKAFFDSKSDGNRKKLWQAARANGLVAYYSSFLNHLAEHGPGHGLV